MKHFFYKLIPPRPSFAQDMTEQEAQLMQEHAVYWRGLMDQGLVVVVGVVADPTGAYGIGVVELEDDADPHVLGANDPAVKANAGFRFEMHPMPRPMVRR
jgi:uncharacterized protein